MELYFFIKCGKQYQRILNSEILYLESIGNYAKLVTDKNRVYITQLSLSHWEHELSEKEFCRVHKSYLVSVAKILVIDNKEVEMENHMKIPVGLTGWKRLSKEAKLVHRVLKPETQVKQMLHSKSA